MAAPKPKPDTLVNLSGGKDSVYALYLALENGWKPVAHHCYFVTSDKRHDWELRAVNETCAWLARRGHQFPLYRTAFNLNWKERPALNQRNLRRQMPDIYYIAFTSAVILRQHPTIQRVVVSANADDHALKTYAGRAQRRRAYVEHAVKTLAKDRTIEWAEPCGHLTTREIIAAMPPDLFALTCYCRQPGPKGQPCWQRKSSGWCRTCKLVHAALKELGRLR